MSSAINMNTTTSKFQKNPNYFMSEAECKANKDVNTNPRYPYFRQTHFTAGDVEQFETYRDPETGSVCMKSVDLSRNIYSSLPDPENIDWERYQDITSTSVDDTFKYLFYKMKKAIFIKIQDNQVRVFLPFSNVSYTNDWGDRMRLERRFPDYHSFFNYSRSQVGKTVDRNRVNNNPYMWYGNNCLMRSELPIGEGDASYGNMIDMFSELCANREVPDCEFFINKRDFPLLKRDGTEAYDAIFGEDFPLLSHNYRTYAPLLGMVTTDKNADIPMPTWEDWARVSSEDDGKFFDTCRDYRMEFNTPWSEKIPVAVFRGATTGCGTTPETNIRLRLAKMNQAGLKDADGLPFMDAGISSWNTRPRKEPGIDYLTTIEVKKLGIELLDSISPQQQSQHKYIINVDGHVSAFRLSLEMKMGSVILLADSKYRMWYRRYLQPWVHYVPIKEDLSDLYEQIKWCKTHDAECQQIVANAKTFYTTYLSKNAIFDYLQNLLVKMKKINGNYLYSVAKPENVLAGLKIESIKSKMVGKFSPPSPFVFKNNCYGFYRGIEMYFQLAESNKVLLDQFFTRRKVLVDTTNKKITSIEFNGLNFLLEKDKPEKFIELLHEAFVGTKAVNILTKVVPNFMYTFGLFDKEATGDTCLLSEYIPGESLDQYLSGEYFNLNEFFLILIQLGLALRYAQDQCGFCHLDLYPHNVILKRLEEPVVVEYPIGVEKIYRITTNLIPVIIDYGRSQVVVDNIYYSMVRHIDSTPFHDMNSIIISSLHLILNKRLDRTDLGKVFDLVKWFVGTSYRPTNFENVFDLKDWIRQKRKFSDMLYSDKGTLGQRDVLSFVDFLHLRFQHAGKMEIVTTYNPSIFEANERIVFELLNAGTRQPQEIFTKYLEGILTCSLPQPKNTFMRFQAFQAFEKSIEGLTSILDYYQEVFDIASLAPLVERAISTVRHVIFQGVGETPEEVKYVRSRYPMSPSQIPYDFNDFDDPFVLADRNESILRYTLPDYVKYRSNIVETFLYNGPGSLPQKYREFYLRNFDNLISMNPFAVILDRAYGNTYRVLAEEIMKKNIIYVGGYKPIEGENCETAMIFLDQYEKVLREIK